MKEKEEVMSYKRVVITEFGSPPENLLTPVPETLDPVEAVSLVLSYVIPI